MLYLLAFWLGGMLAMAGLRMVTAEEEPVDLTDLLGISIWPLIIIALIVNDTMERRELWRIHQKNEAGWEEDEDDEDEDDDWKR